MVDIMVGLMNNFMNNFDVVNVMVVALVEVVVVVIRVRHQARRLPVPVQIQQTGRNGTQERSHDEDPGLSDDEGRLVEHPRAEVQSQPDSGVDVGGSAEGGL